MAQPRTFYVLGAGASYGLIPVTSALKQNILVEYHSVGAYPTTRIPSTPIFERLLGYVSPHEENFRTVLLTHMPHGTLDLLVQRALWRPTSSVIPPQYGVFEYTPYPATIFNFNLDGLASLHCGHRHIVIEPHGRIDVPWLEHHAYRELLEATILYDVRLEHLTPKLLPAPEPDGFAQSITYTKARKLFQFARAMVVLGYSFGQRGTTLDDAQSFDFLVKLAKRHSVPILVVSPTPDELSERLRDALSTNSVYAIKLRWEVFSGLLLAAVNPAEGVGQRWCSTRISDLVRAYENALDAL